MELIGDVFCGESMFGKITDASKVAFYHLCQQAQQKWHQTYRLSSGLQ